MNSYSSYFSCLFFLFFLHLNQKYLLTYIYLREMLDIILVFFWCSPNCDVIFKTPVELKIIIIDF